MAKRNENDIHAGKEGNFNEEWWTDVVVDGLGWMGRFRGGETVVGS